MAEVLPQLNRLIAVIRARNDDRPVALVAHSWGSSVAAAYASLHPRDVRALLLFGPIVPRKPSPMSNTPAASVAIHYPCSCGRSTAALWKTRRAASRSLDTHRPWLRCASLVVRRLAV